MKILVLGGGGREHALISALQGAGELVCAPGNGGIAAVARCEPLDVAEVAATKALVEREQPDLVVVGPEIPLAAGVVDALRGVGIRVFGPTKAAAQLESSKGFAKEFMKRWGIPTAAYAVCHTSADVKAALPGFAASVVIKADGLAAGKGVVLCNSHEEALHVAEEMFGGELLGAAVESLVLEETLTGPELSFFSICDGTTAKTMAFAQDHKRAGEGDTGPNTGGMGAYCTDDLVAPETAEWLRVHVAQRVVDGMKAEGFPFQGVLFTGLMMTPTGPRVLEFNTRFGDPETEAILLRLETPLLDILEAAVEGRIGAMEIKLKPGASACVVAASGGYPGKYASGQVISGLDWIPPGVEVFHAGTALVGDRVVTAGGRVLAVSAAGVDLRGALGKIYGALSEIHFERMQYRRDIGWQALENVTNASPSDLAAEPISVNGTVIRRCNEEDFDQVWSTINEGAEAYQGVIPADRCESPYMSREKLRSEIADGVLFWGLEDDAQLVGVMGIQQVQDVTLIRHAYVRTAHQGHGIGAKLLAHLRRLADRPVLIGTWADATWAINFYQRHGFSVVDPMEKDRLLKLYWKVPARQVETSVVLADEAWRLQRKVLRKVTETF